MSAPLDYPPLIDYQDPVSIANRAQPVGDDKGCAVLAQRGHRLLDALFRLSIDAAGRFIKDKDTRVSLK